MSHHLATPLAAKTGQLYIDDLYVFPGQDSTVFVLDVNSNVTGDRSEPGFHPQARYELKVHVDGADRETLTYRFSFADAVAGGPQPFRLEALTGADASDDASTGALLVEGRTGESAEGAGVRVWAGRVSDAFYIDLSLLSKVNEAVGKGTAVDLSGWKPGEAKNSFAGTTVDTIVLEVSHEDAALRPDTRIGVWAATKFPTVEGGWRQINRAGHPMMWPIFWPDDVDFADPANTRHPSDDHEQAGRFLAGAVAAVVAATGTCTDPQAYGREVARQLLPDVLPYVVGTPALYGFATRNGRTLADNAPEAMLCLVTNTAVPSGLTPAIAAPQRTGEFPYLVPA